MDEQKTIPAVIGVDLAQGPDQTAVCRPPFEVETLPDGTRVNGPKLEDIANGSAEGNIIPFPSSNQDDKSPVEEEEKKELIDNPDDPLNEFSEQQINQMIKQTREMVQIMENNWMSIKQEFHLTDDQMKMVFQLNDQYKKDPPEYATEEEKNNWDHFNGIAEVTEEDVVKIFGEGHPIIGITHDITKDRLKDFVEDYYNWMVALHEYRNIHKAYMKLIEIQEEKNIELLKAAAEKEENPDQKKKMMDAIDTYYNRKYLMFLAEPLEEQDRTRIVRAFSNEDTISYWLKRSQDKLKQLKMSTKFILEISQFEKRFLPEKYHKQSNILLLYFMMTIIYCSCSDKKDPGRNKAVAMIMTLDQIVQNILDDDKRELVLNNIMAFEDQFEGLLPEPKVEENQ